MLTFARVGAALLYGLVAWYVGTLIQPLYVEERPIPYVPVWNAFFGAIVGWRIAGAQAGKGLSASVGSGTTTTLALVVVCLFAHSFAEMIRLAMRLSYDGPVEAVVDIATIMYDHAQTIATQEIIVTAIVGGLLAAALTELVAGRYD